MIAEIDRIPAIAVVHRLLPSAYNLLQLRELEGTRLHGIGRIAPVQVMPIWRKAQHLAIKLMNAHLHFELENHLEFILPDILNEDFGVMCERRFANTKGIIFQYR